MKTAIIHDWLTGVRGGEKVLEVICELFPGAPLHTLFCRPDRAGPLIGTREVKTSFLQHMPLAGKFYRHYLPLFPIAVEQFDLREYDLVISSSHCAAKGVVSPSTSCHVCYCHTPLRYAWDMYREYFGFGMTPFKKAAVYPALHYLRLWDESSSRRVDYFIANSRFVAQRIRKFYGRGSEVIYPPVDTDFFRPGEPRKDYFLLVSALVPYKRVDVAVNAFTKSGLPLKIAGSGPLRRELERKAGKSVEFLGEVTTEELRELYARSRGFVYTAVEDFGIAPVEAQAAGTPVIGLARGGLLETVIEGETGVFYECQDPDSLLGAVERFSKIRFSDERIRQNAARFDRKVFKSGIENFISEKYREWSQKRRRKY